MHLHHRNFKLSCLILNSGRCNTSGCILTVIYQSVINCEKVVLMIPYIVGAILQIAIMIILKFKKPRAIFDDYNDLGRFDNYEDSREDVLAALL